jgi:DNA-binding NarL/FixJ family response regulator
VGVGEVSGDLVRSAEWRRVRDFARGVGTAPAGLVIQGEAGAGKSTLWRAGIEVAAAAGHRLLRSEPSASESGLSFAGLSDLLTDVLPLVAEGASNRQIACALVVSERTARTHVSAILTKLGLVSRTQAALWAVREGLTPGLEVS